MNNINKKITSATKWSIFTEGIVKIISPITNLVIARILSPEEFGIVATVIMIISLSDLLTDAGFQKFLIQHKFESDEELDSSACVAFWSNFIISLSLWILICIFSDKIAILVGNVGLGNVIRIASISLIITSFSSIQVGIYRKKFEFKVLAFTRIITKIIPVLITIPLALLGFSYWSIIIGNLIGEFINALILTIKSSWKPKLEYDINILLKMINFCGWTLIESLSGWLVSNIGIFIIGMYYNNYYLGIYKTSITTVSQITSIISSSIINVLFTSLSSLKDDEQEYNNILFKFQRNVGLISMPLGVGIFIFRDTITYILLGSQWNDAVLLIGLWGFIICESIIFADFGATVLLSKGKPKNIVFTNIVQIMLIVIILTCIRGKEFYYLVIAVSLVRLQLPLMQLFWIIKFTDIKIKEMYSNLRFYIIPSISMGICGMILKSLYSSLIIDLIYIIICMSIYFILLYIFTKGNSFNLKLRGIKYH